MNSAPSLKVVASPKPRGEQPPAEASVTALDVETMRSYYRWGGHLSTALVRIRSKFDGDLDQCLLYLIFLLSELSQTMASTAPDRAFARRGLNALSLSDITQIPRETARRKLLALAERGYLVRAEDGLFVLGDLYGLDEFFTDLKPLFWDAVKVAPGR